MKVETVASPAAIQQANQQADAKSAEVARAAKERALAILAGGKGAPQGAQAQTTPDAVAHAQAQANKTTPENGQTDTIVEPQATPEVPKAAVSEKAEEPISSQFAVLARKEKQYRAKVQAQDAAFKAREAELAKKQAELEAKAQEYNTNYIPKQKLTEDTIQTLLEAGISYDKITELALQQGTASQDPALKAVISELRAEIKALKGESENTKKSIVEGQENNYKQALNQIRLDVKDLVKEGNDFEAIRATDSVDDVVELIERTFKEDGVLLTNEEAAKQVEEELVNRISKYATLSKIQQKFKTPNTKAASQQTGNAPKPQSQGGSQPQPAKTLTNNMSNTRQLTARERAILAFENKLGK